MESADREFYLPFPPLPQSPLDVSTSPINLPVNHPMEDQLLHNWNYNIWRETDQNQSYLRGLQRPIPIDHGCSSMEYQRLQRMIMQNAAEEEMMTRMHDKFGNFSIASQNFRPNRETVNESRPWMTSFMNDFQSCCNVRSSSTRNGVKINNPMHSTPTQNFSMEDMKGRVLLVAKDQYGCRLLQQKLEEGVGEDAEVIYSEVKDHFHELMVDQFGNYFVQKILETSDAERMSNILASIVGNQQKLAQVCLDTHGTRVVQKLLEFLQTPEQIAFAISAIKPITVVLIKSVNGGHVIQQCLNLFTIAHTKHLLDVIAQNCLEIATDKRGCCTLQHCLSHARGEASKRLVDEIVAFSLVLSENPYGNYVVQYMVGLKITNITIRIIRQLFNRFVQLSMDKFGSNVVEVLLKNSPQEYVTMIVQEISFSKCFLNVLQDPYGNYVVQTALKETKRIPGGIHKFLVNGVLLKYAFLHSHPHGKRVLACIKGGSNCG